MNTVEVLDEKIVLVADILEQIASLNRRIAFHKLHEGDASTIKQYEEMRADFAQKLRTLLQAFNLDTQIRVQD